MHNLLQIFSTYPIKTWSINEPDTKEFKVTRVDVTVDLKNSFIANDHFRLILIKKRLKHVMAGLIED